MQNHYLGTVIGGTPVHDREGIFYLSIIFISIDDSTLTMFDANYGRSSENMSGEL